MTPSSCTVARGGRDAPDTSATKTRRVQRKGRVISSCVSQGSWGRIFHNDNTAGTAHERTRIRMSKVTQFCQLFQQKSHGLEILIFSSYFVVPDLSSDPPNVQAPNTDFQPCTAPPPHQKVTQPKMIAIKGCTTQDDTHQKVVQPKMLPIKSYTTNDDTTRYHLFLSFARSFNKYFLCPKEEKK